MFGAKVTLSIWNRGLGLKKFMNHWIRGWGVKNWMHFALAFFLFFIFLSGAMNVLEVVIRIWHFFEKCQVCEYTEAFQAWAFGVMLGRALWSAIIWWQRSLFSLHTESTQTNEMGELGRRSCESTAFITQFYCKEVVYENAWSIVHTVCLYFIPSNSQEWKEPYEYSGDIHGYQKSSVKSHCQRIW